MQSIIVRLICFLFCVTPVWSFQRTQELISVPTAFMDRGGLLEYGVVTTGYQDKNKTMHGVNETFFRYAFSNTFQYALNVDQDRYFRHHVQVKLAEWSEDDSNVHQAIAYGIRNIGYETPRIQTSDQLQDFYGVYSMKADIQRTNYHIGFGRDFLTKNYLPFAGVEYLFSFGRLIVEFDGRSTNFGMRFNNEEGRHFWFVITPQAHKEEGFLQESFRLGLSYSMNIFDRYSEGIVRNDDYIDAMDSINKRLAIVEAKEKALSELLSRRYLDELEKSLIRQKLEEKKMDDATKSLVGGAVAHMQKGLEDYYAGRYKMALNEYLTVVSLLPTFPMGYVRLGSIYLKLGDKKKAIENWEKALSLNPDDNALRRYLNQLIKEQTQSAQTSAENTVEGSDEIL